jgi:hypothetical protein
LCERCSPLAFHDREFRWTGTLRLLRIFMESSHECSDRSGFNYEYVVEAVALVLGILRERPERAREHPCPPLQDSGSLVDGSGVPAHRWVISNEAAVPSLSMTNSRDSRCETTGRSDQEVAGFGVAAATSTLGIYVASNVKGFVVMRGSRKAGLGSRLVCGCDIWEEFHVDCSEPSRAASSVSLPPNRSTR